MRLDERTLSHETSETIRRPAVQRVKDGEVPSSAIKGYGLCRTTIYKWLTVEPQGGPAALTARNHPGPAVTPRQKLVRVWHQAVAASDQACSTASPNSTVLVANAFSPPRVPRRQ